MPKCVKIFDAQGIPLGFKDYDDVSSVVSGLNVKLYNEDGTLVGVSGVEKPQVLMLDGFTNADNEEIELQVDYYPSRNHAVIHLGDEELTDFPYFKFYDLTLYDYETINIKVDNGITLNEIVIEDGVYWGGVSDFITRGMSSSVSKANGFHVSVETI